MDKKDITDTISSVKDDVVDKRDRNFECLNIVPKQNKLNMCIISRLIS
jgi:hypothetical protein